MENKHLLAEDDWFLLLFNDAGDVIGSRRLANPDRFSPILHSGQSFPFFAKVPRMQSLSAVAIYDQRQEEQLRVPVDSSFRSGAVAARREFLSHDRETRRLLLEEAAAFRESAIPAAPQPGTVGRFENYPDDLRRQINGEIALEMQRLEQYGAGTMNLHRSLSAEPEEIELIAGVNDFAGPTAAAAPIVYSPAGIYTLSGQVTDLDSGAPVAGLALDFYQYDANYQYIGLIDRRITDSNGDYSIPVDAGYVRIRPDYSTVTEKQYVWAYETVKIDATTVWNLKAIPGVLLSGAVTNFQSQGVYSAVVQTYSKELKLYTTSATTSSGRYAAIVPKNRVLNITVSPPFPYIPPAAEYGAVLTVDTVRNFRVDTGWVVSGVVTGENGAAISGASVLLRQLAATTTGTPYWYATADNAGSYRFAVAKDLQPNCFVLAAYATSYMLQSTGLEVTRDATRDIQLLKGNTVSGTVRDNSEKALSGVRIRAYSRGVFVNSALTKSDGTYAFDLPAGTYEVDALPPAGSTLAPSTAGNVVISAGRTMDFILPPAAGILTVRLYFPSEEIYNRFRSKDFVRFELYQSGLTVYAGSGIPGSGGLDGLRGKYFRPYTLYVISGRYDLLAFPAGCQPIPLAGIDVSGSVTVSLDVPDPFLWTGVLRGADNKPLGGSTIQSSTDLARQNEYTSTDAAGQFNVFLTPNGFVKFFTDAASYNILHTERPGNGGSKRDPPDGSEAYSLAVCDFSAEGNSQHSRLQGRRPLRGCAILYRRSVQADRILPDGERQPVLSGLHRGNCSKVDGHYCSDSKGKAQGSCCHHFELVS